MIYECADMNPRVSTVTVLYLEPDLDVFGCPLTVAVIHLDSCQDFRRFAMVGQWLSWRWQVLGSGFAAYQPYDGQFIRGGSPRPVVLAGAADTQQDTVTHRRRGLVLGIDDLLPPLPALNLSPSAITISLHIKLDDLLVEPDDEGCVTFRTFGAVSGKDAGTSFQQEFLPSLDLAAMDLVPGSELGHRLLHLNRL